MDFKELGKTIADKAPFIATALGTLVLPGAGGAVGALAGNLIKKYFGTGTDEPDKLAEMVQQDPQAAAKLMLAEYEFKLELRKLDVEETRAFLGDVQNARQREVEVVKATGKKDWSTETMGWFVIIGFFALLFTRMFIKIPLDQAENVGLLMGAAITAFITLITYKWGSSKGSADKAAEMADLLKKPK